MASADTIHTPYSTSTATRVDVGTNDHDKPLTTDELALFLARRLQIDTPLVYKQSLQNDTELQVRILWLEPGAFQEPIQCRLETVVLAEAAPFEALSYCWGPTDPEAYIHVDGCLVRVTPNLKLALQRLRLGSRPRPLWVDAICINQNDLSEKSSQVQRMRDIYQKANLTTVWMGEEENGSRLALDMCTRMVAAHAQQHLQESYLVDIRKEYQNWTARRKTSARHESESALIEAFSRQFDLDAASLQGGFRRGYDSVRGEGAYAALTQERYDEVKAEAMTELVEEIKEKEAKHGITGLDVNDPEKYFKELGQLMVQYREQGLKWKGPFQELIAEGDPLLGEDGGSDAESKVHTDAMLDTSDANGTVIRNQECEEYSSSGPYASAVKLILESNAVASETEPPTSDEITALHVFFERPWFRRIWIVQEAAVSRHLIVQCGSQQIDWWILAFGNEIASKLKRGVRVGPKYHHNLMEMSRLNSSLTLKGVDWRTQLGVADAAGGNMDMKDLELLSLLVKYRRYLATNPRDKVFALLGLTISNLEQLDIRPDYALPVTEIYTAVAQALMERTESLDVLAVPCNRTRDSSGLPSWVPDWADVDSQPYLLSDRRETQNVNDMVDSFREFTASQGTKPLVVIEDGRLLHTSGYAMDTIVAIGGVMDITDRSLGFTSESMGDDEPSKDFWGKLNEVLDGVQKDAEVVKGWTELARVSDPSYRYPGTGEDAFTAFARTVYTDTDKKTYWADCQNWIERFGAMGQLLKNMPRFDLNNLTWESIMAAGQQIRPMMGVLNSPEMQSVGQRSCVHTLYRRLARTHTGRLALVPANTVIDDQVAILQGGKTPYILRPQEDGYKLVGESYVHGIMYGEAWSEGHCHTITIH